MAPGRPIRILIVDDSAVMRSLLRSVVAADPGLEVAGAAADGASALSSIGTLPPDLILLDVEMPVMDGLATLRELRKRGHKMPVIMCSSLTQRGAKVTLEALACGASDYVAKPAGQSNREAAIRALGFDLSPRIHALTSQQQAPQAALQQPPYQSQKATPGQAPSSMFPGRWPTVTRGGLFAPMASARAQPIRSTQTVLAIGVSTGGPAALDVLLPALPATFPLPILIVQHMPELFTKVFADRLDANCKLRVREAADGDRVHPGIISIARGNWHMEVLAAVRAGSPHTLRLNQDPPENHCRPAVDVLFRTAVAVYGSRILAVVLTGMGADGLAGCRLIRDHVNFFILDVVVVEPAHRLVTPPAVRLDK